MPLFYQSERIIPARKPEITLAKRELGIYYVDWHTLEVSLNTLNSGIEDSLPGLNRGPGHVGG